MTTATREEAEKKHRLSPGSLWLAMGAYAVLIGVLAAKHEMWRDEVRAFSVATTASSWGALLADLHHEGHPIVWYAILRAGYSITHSPLVLPLAALTIGMLTAYLILRYGPFPVWLRLLALFGPFMGYELTVVSRNYGIGVLMMIIACLAYKVRSERPLYLGIALALLANTSVHGAAASLLLAAFWLTDVFRDDRRKSTLAPLSILALLLVVAGAAFAFWTAHPSSDMAWAFSVSSLDYGKVAGAVFSDPGKSLLGFHDANIVAAGELPWGKIGLDPSVASRILVDAALAWLFWSLRGSWRAIVAIALACIGFAIVFRNIYTGGLRHEGILLFLIFSICWMTVTDSPVGSTVSARGIAIGLLPLFALQTAALPMVAFRVLKYPESDSKAFAQLVDANPKYQNAILMAEPDYMGEAFHYYLRNPVFMARQGDFEPRVYFDKGVRRRYDMTLGQFVDVADSLSCARKVPVLIAIGYKDFAAKRAGQGILAYKPSMFLWSESDWIRLHAMQPGNVPIATLPLAATDESYQIFEVSPITNGTCELK